MRAKELALDKRACEVEWTNDKCDKYDYMIAAFCGFSAGIIDSLFIRTPGQSKLGNLTDKGADAFIQKLANMLWQGDGRSTMDGKTRKAPDTLEKAISYLEQSFPVNYDARYAPDLQNTNGALSSMVPKNHHLLSLAHSPDVIGLIFSILDQFTNAASFIDNGKLIRLYPIKDARNNKVMYMQGTRFESKIFCGICNWLGHLASDLCGSSSTRKLGKVGRGAGLSIPFYEIFLMMDFGDFDGVTFADIAVKVFEEGYDLRHGVAMAIPLMITELSIKLIWALKRHFYAKKDWKDCIPSHKHSDLRIMIIVGDATLCLVDGADAAIHSAVQGGNPLTLMLHLNFVAWTRLIMLVFKELRIRYGSIIDKAVGKYLAELGLNDNYALQLYYNRMNALDQKFEQLLKAFVVAVERDYKEFLYGVNSSLNPLIGTAEQRRIASVKFAEKQEVSADRIMRTPEELKHWLGEGWK
ncbi:hypothetical protein [Clostridium novyi]|uniref:hypothetical protein n=1 Tax=Clostridium novyi TaxID=1542 RepID=UPI00068D81E4|nr:hypothetical protein [Clostridium novyi]